MTPERAAYHRLMLLAGLDEEYKQELDRVLETEDPIPDPELDLAFCMSDLDRTVSILYNYTLDHPFDEQQVHDMVIGTLRRTYIDRRITAEAVCEALGKIQRIGDNWEVWIDLHEYLYDYELLDEGLISREDFLTCFEAAFLRGERIDVWSRQPGTG